MIECKKVCYFEISHLICYIFNYENDEKQKADDDHQSMR